MSDGDGTLTQQTDETCTYYHFASGERSGYATEITAEPGDGKQRVEIEVPLPVYRHVKDSDTWIRTTIKRPVQLYGPGDIVGFDERMVVRTDPKPHTGNFEPNYFPLIEFADADFPWRFSPKPAVNNRLAPWIVLIVLIAEDQGEEICREYTQIPRDRNQTPAIKVFSKQTSLPDLEKAWRWAHVQVTNDQERLTKQEMEEFIETYPRQAISRLLCPRRLQPKTLYTAFVVPAFKLGWAAGLDTPAALEEAKGCGAADLSWTWDPAEDGPIELPYYYNWDFRTSVRGDFEHLVRLLEPRELTGLGLREIDCERPGFGLTVSRQELDEEDPRKHRLDMEGALQSLGTSYTRWGKDKNGPLYAVPPPPIPEPDQFQQQLAEELLSRANADQALVELPEDFKKPAMLDSLALNLLEDGKSVRFVWTTKTDTTGYIQYGQVHARGVFSYTDECTSDHLGTTHQVTAVLAPETPYRFRLVITNKAQESSSTDELLLRVPLPAVVPPIYGRWHAARKNVVADRQHNGWLDVLNLDPRHRAAAGLGSKVVRKQQEALMAAAWEQIGAIEAANDVLRRAQMGREVSHFVHERLKMMALENFMRITAPVKMRVPQVEDSLFSSTIRTGITETRIRTALSPAFRRIARARGPIGRRQRRGRQGQRRRMDILRRLVSGEVTYHRPYAVEMANIGEFFPGEEATLNTPPASDDLLRSAFVPDSGDGADSGHEGISHDGQSNAAEEELASSAIYLKDLRVTILDALDPRITIQKRTRERLRLNGGLAGRFEEGAPGDPLDEIMAYPEFPQPMYESLRDDSKAHILPGVEKVPQNTVGLLETNRRFLESYMVGLNHEFAAELLWRRYPTDQRGSYFRQFWDVSEFVPKSDPASERPQVTDDGELTEDLREALKDIRPLHLWGKLAPLGHNDNWEARKKYDIGKPLVLLIRGDLLKRYPNAVIYSVDARTRGEVLLPQLPEIGEPSPDEEEMSEWTEPIYPIFRGSLGADLVFLGFPFSEDEARSSTDGNGAYSHKGKFFVLEERVNELRFGLDAADTSLPPQNDPPIPVKDGDWNNLHWGYFQLAEPTEAGKYLDESTGSVAGPDNEVWDENTSAALRAKITLQKPARLVVHADQMMPEKPTT